MVANRIALIMEQFHSAETSAMLEEARLTAREHGLEIVAEVYVPGSMEAPLAAKRLLLRDSVDGAVVLGIIERGETKHGLVMSLTVVKALVDLQLSLMKPIGMGILGPEIFPSQVESRTRPYARAATEAVAHMLMAESVR